MICAVAPVTLHPFPTVEDEMIPRHILISLTKSEWLVFLAICTDDPAKEGDRKQIQLTKSYSNR